MSKGLLYSILIVALVLGGVTPGTNVSNSQAANLSGILTQSHQLLVGIITNVPPQIANPPDGANFPVNTSFNFVLEVTATDADSDLIAISVDTPVSGFQFDSISVIPGYAHYRFQWTPAVNDTGQYLATFTANDHHSGTAQSEISISSTRSILDIGDLPILPGMSVTIPINLTNTGVSSYVGGLNILLRYPEESIHFQTATRGERIDGWQYFNYALGDSSTIRIVGLARMTDANPYMTPGEGPIVYLNFIADTSQGYMGHYADIIFYGPGINDNTLADTTGYRLIRPSLNNGWVYFLSPNDILIGDINLNGIRYEVSDGVLFANRLINPAMFPFNPIQQVASDCNGDFIPETLQDFIYLINVLNGHIPPGAIEYGPEQAATINLVPPPDSEGNYTFSYDGPVSAGGVLMRIRHAGTILNQPVLAGDYEMYYDDRDGILSILVFNSNGNTINSGDPIFSIEPLSENAQLSIMELQISDSYGNVIPNRPEPITPARFELYGAFPNPFNSSTVIKFSLPEPSNVSLSIFNLSGQLVRTINLENYPAGESQVIWDGANQEKQPVASGVYFYRLKAGIFESTKRMTLMK